MLGTVNDPAGAVISGARITIKSDDLGVSFSTTSNDSGNYFQTQLPVGTYTLEIEAPGFQRYVAKGVQVSVGTSTRVDAALSVGQITEQVNVSSVAPTLVTDRAEVST